MKALLKTLGLGLVVIVTLAAIAFVVLHRSSIPYATLEKHYGSPASRYLDLPDGVHVHYRDEGPATGPVIVLVHGFSDSTATWDSWITTLKVRNRVISLDLPGHGLTRAPGTWPAGTTRYVALLDQVVNRLGVRRFAIVGNSMGGSVAWNYALSHPDRLTALVLVDAAGWPAPPPKPGQKSDGALAFQMLRTPWGRWLLSRVDLGPVIADGLRKAYHDPSKVTDAMINRFSDLSHAPDHPAIILGMQDRAWVRATPEAMARIRTPTLVLHGADDRLIPVEAGRRFAATIPEAELIIYPDSGHTPQMEIPARSVADLSAFLARHPADDGHEATHAEGPSPSTPSKAAAAPGTGA
jgi:pimeloyl-ACP methyl ester carboxylesterase